MTKLYLSGPMSGLPEFNYPAFEEATQCLRAAGYDVVSPHELDREAGVDPNVEFTHTDRIAAMKRDLIAVLESDGVAVLPAWKASTGAQAEVATAHSISLPVQYVEAWEAAA